jgi:hypothetical protein
MAARDVRTSARGWPDRSVESKAPTLRRSRERLLTVMLIPPCGRSIPPCCFSAEKSRARFFAPLRCAQNDSMAGECSMAACPGLLWVPTGKTPTGRGSLPVLQGQRPISAFSGGSRSARQSTANRKRPKYFRPSILDCRLSVAGYFSQGQKGSPGVY